MSQNDSPGEDQALPRTTAELLTWIDWNWSALNQTLSELPPDQQATVRDAQGWSAKDHLVHITAWEQSLLALLQGRDRDQALGLNEAERSLPDIDAVNDVVYQRARERTLDEVLDAAQQSHQDVVAAIATLSDEDLFKPYSHYQPNDPPTDGRPVIGWIIGNSSEHYQEHNAYIRVLNALP